MIVGKVGWGGTDTLLCHVPLLSGWCSDHCGNPNGMIQDSEFPDEEKSDL